MIELFLLGKILLIGGLAFAGWRRVNNRFRRDWKRALSDEKFRPTFAAKLRLEMDRERSRPRRSPVWKEERLLAMLTMFENVGEAIELMREVNVVRRQRLPTGDSTLEVHYAWAAAMVAMVTQDLAAMESAVQNGYLTAELRQIVGSRCCILRGDGRGALDRLAGLDETASKHRIAWAAAWAAHSGPSERVMTLLREVPAEELRWYVKYFSSDVAATLARTLLGDGTPYR